jgi:CheY-like chemotaxis protein
VLKDKVIVLVDDHEPTNILHAKVIKDHIPDLKVFAYTDPFQALEFLNHANPEERVEPDIIFLDINMNAIDGWDFLDIYKKMASVQNPDVHIVLLSLSDELPDKEKASANKLVKRYLVKPLTKETLINVLDAKF